MKNQKSLALGVLTAVAFACLLTAARGQTSNDGKLAEVTGGGSSVRWDVTVPNAGASLIISAPDGRVFTREYRSGASLEMVNSDPVLWTMLNAIKEQQNEIVQLRRQVQQLRAARRVRPRARR